MEKRIENKFRKVSLISRYVLCGSILLMLSPTFSAYTEGALLFRILITLGLMLFILYWMMPVFFLLARKQAFAIAWSRGLASQEYFKKIDLTNIPMKEKIYMYLNYILSCFMLVIVLFLFLDMIWS
jgi:hypothetical protein